MKNASYEHQISLEYLEYLHTTTLPDKARDQYKHGHRLTVGELPFWQEINFEKTISTIAESRGPLFINADFRPSEFNKYLQRTVIYAEKIVLPDPIATLYEWRDRGVVNSEQFHELLDASIALILSFYPLIEEGILIFLPQPYLWNNLLDSHIGEDVHAAFANRRLMDSLLTDYESDLRKNEVIERWLNRNDIPNGWSEHQKEFAVVNIASGGMHELLNGIYMAEGLNANLTSCSMNTWNHFRVIYGNIFDTQNDIQKTIADILPLTELPYIDNNDWSKIIRFRKDHSMFIKFRKTIAEVAQDIKDYRPEITQADEFADNLAKIVQNMLAELQDEKQLLADEFQPAAMKALLAGGSALIGNIPLASIFGAVSLFDVYKTSKTYQTRSRQLRRNPLFTLYG